MKHPGTGLTVVEVLIALVVVAIAVSLLATATVSSARHDANSGSRTQAVQILNYLGRLVAANDENVLLSDRNWGYGELQSAFSEMSTEARRADPNLYRASVTEDGAIGLGTAAGILYEIQVCWRAAQEENCVNGSTAGLPFSVGGAPAPDPVVN